MCKPANALTVTPPPRITQSSLGYSTPTISYANSYRIIYLVLLTPLYVFCFVIPKVRSLIATLIFAMF
nr:MAG TPA: hypothetical protein [Caudoviricetes sp.]